MNQLRLGLSIFLSLIYSVLCLNAQSLSPMTSYEIDKIIENSMRQNKEVYYWKNASDHMLWSALMQADQMVGIGYKPASLTTIDIANVDVYNPAWTAARNTIIDFIVNKTNEQRNGDFTKEDLMPFGEVKSLPYIIMRVADLATVSAVRQLAEVRYFDPMGYTFTPMVEHHRGGTGCGGYATPEANINTADYVSITPASRQSWHQIESNVDEAWTKSTKGEDVWIAVIDSGVELSQSQLNGDFGSGESDGSNRMIENYAYYSATGMPPYDGVDDQCGHGTAMTGLAAAPRGFDNTPAGAAYKSNVMTFRATCDVVLNATAEQTGVAEALTQIANDPRSQIVSMSIGNVTASGTISDAIIAAEAQGIMIFAAAGTSTAFTNWFPVIFPANMPETIAVTGVEDAATLNQCDICHDGPEVDFVVCMQRANDSSRTGLTTGTDDNSTAYVGGSSNATATTAGIAALVWGNHPNWTKEQVYDRMAESGSFFPNRDGDLGWGKVDAGLAVACPPNFNLIGFEFSPVHFETSGEITSTQVIKDPCIADYDATTYIDLLPGFEVELGAEFHAHIDGCN